MQMRLLPMLYVKGFRDYDIDLAYEAIRKDAMHPPLRDTERHWGDRG